MLPERIRKFRLKPTSFLIGIIVVVLIMTGGGLFYLFQDKVKQGYSIGIILSSVEISPEDRKALEFIIGKKLDDINHQGGINRRPVKAIYLDDKGDLNALYRLVEKTSRNENLIAFIGSKGSTRARKLAPLLARRKIPYIGRYTMTNLLKPYPNMYSSEIDFRDFAVVFRHILLNKSKRAAFIGWKGDLHSEGLLLAMDSMAQHNPDFKVVLRKWYPLDHKFSQQEFKVLADSLKSQADFLVLSAEAEFFRSVIRKLWLRDIHLPVYCGLTDIMQLDYTSPHFLQSEYFDINAFGVPGVQNMRINEQILTNLNTLKTGKKLEFQLGFSGRLVDEIGLIREAALDESLPEKLPIREKIIRGLKGYSNGNKVYKGWFSDWSFTSDHGYATEGLVSWKPRGYAMPLLAPRQFIHNDSTGILEPGLPVLYTNIDLQELSVDGGGGNSFSATFYLKLTSARDIRIDQIDFANADRNKINQEPLLNAKLIRRRKDNREPAFYNYLYKVTGKFLFDPEYERYPFDQQRFPIRLQPKNAFAPFLVQPPRVQLRDTVFNSSGWIYQKSFVGCDQDLITAENDFSSLQKTISTYNFSFVYILKRARIDFTLKTFVPLMALLVISYFSVFIQHREFEAMAGIQVTALLAAIALYFSTFKPETQIATVSDKIFIFTYIMITSLIGTSIYLNIRFQNRNLLTRASRIYQRWLFPVIVVAFSIFLRF